MASEATDPVLLEALEEGILQLTLHRPERLNALTLGLVDGLHAALDQIDRDRGARVVILTGAGRGFCAGLDLGGFGVVPGTEEAEVVEQNMTVQKHIVEAVARLRSLRQPVIAAVNGAAAGGGLALALASDIRVAAESAKFTTAFIKLGVSGCDMGVSWILPRLIGASRAWELMLTSRLISASEADELGLLTRLVPDAELIPTALGIARQIAELDAYAVWMTKEGMWSNLETGSLRAAIDLENRTQMMCLQNAVARQRLGGARRA